MDASVLDPDLLRTCLSRFVTGVTVVSYRAGGEVRGTTVNSFTSVSLAPPLILVSLARSTRAAEHLSRVPFSVNVLPASQLDVALRFAGRPARPAPVEWLSRGDDLAPTLHGALATFRCRPWQAHAAGDHVLHLGRVVDAAIHGDGEPLLFDRGRFATLGGRGHDGDQLDVGAMTSILEPPGAETANTRWCGNRRRMVAEWLGDQGEKQSA